MKHSPYWIYNKPCDEENHTKHNEEEVTQALVFGVVGQLGCLFKKNTTQMKHYDKSYEVKNFFSYTHQPYQVRRLRLLISLDFSQVEVTGNTKH